MFLSRKRLKGSCLLNRHPEKAELEASDVGFLLSVQECKLEAAQNRIRDSSCSKALQSNLALKDKD